MTSQIEHLENTPSNLDNVLRDPKFNFPRQYTKSNEITSGDLKKFCNILISKLNSSSDSELIGILNEFVRQRSLKKNQKQSSYDKKSLGHLFNLAVVRCYGNTKRFEKIKGKLINSLITTKDS